MYALIHTFLLLLSLVDGVKAAQEAVYGLEYVKTERVYDPDARTERFLLVSGSLKLTGGLSGNLWEMVTYVPQKTAAPRTDRGHIARWGNTLRFYSHLTFGTYTGLIIEDGDRLKIEKRARDGRSQSEVWYIVRN